MMRTVLSIPGGAHRQDNQRRTEVSAPWAPMGRGKRINLRQKKAERPVSNFEHLPPTNVDRKEFNRRANKMYRIAITVAALGLTACSTASPYATSISAQDVNCGAGVLGGALLGGLAGNQVGKGQGQDLATAAGATIGGLFGATRPECQPQVYGQQQGYRAYPQGYGQPVTYARYPQAPVLVGYDRSGRPVYR